MRASPSSSRTVELGGAGRAMHHDALAGTGCTLHQSSRKKSHPNGASPWVRPVKNQLWRPEATLTSSPKNKPLFLEKEQPAGYRDIKLPIHGKSCCPVNRNSNIQVLRNTSAYYSPRVLSPSRVPGFWAD